MAGGLHRKDVKSDDSSDISESSESELSTDEGAEDRDRIPEPPPPPTSTSTAGGKPVECEHIPPHHGDSVEQDGTKCRERATESTTDMEETCPPPPRTPQPRGTRAQCSSPCNVLHPPPPNGTLRTPPAPTPIHATGEAVDGAAMAMPDGAEPERRQPHKRLFPTEKRAHKPSGETPYPADKVPLV